MKKPSPWIWIVVALLFAGGMVAMNALGRKVTGNTAATDAPAAGGGHDHDGDGKSDH